MFINIWLWRTGELRMRVVFFSRSQILLVIFMSALLSVADNIRKGAPVFLRSPRILRGISDISPRNDGSPH